MVAYFKAAGLPPEQIGGVHVNTLMAGGGMVGARSSDRLVGYYSVVERVVDGMPVGDSYAWARFNIDDDVVEEEVFWPELPSEVRDQIGTSTMKLQDPKQSALLNDAIDKYRPGLGAAQKKLYVFHTNGISSFPFSASVGLNVFALDVPGHSRRSGTLQFDMNGAQIVRDEQLRAADPR